MYFLLVLSIYRFLTSASWRSIRMALIDTGHREVSHAPPASSLSTMALGRPSADTVTDRGQLPAADLH